ncbi:hypothetical protein M0804_011373 [Polistes exclamans]|nr:hypothetical protein M0804_011373 [Polistes exclamans]
MTMKINDNDDVGDALCCSFCYVITKDKTDKRAWLVGWLVGGFGHGLPKQNGASIFVNTNHPIPNAHCSSQQNRR